MAGGVPTGVPLTVLRRRMTIETDTIVLNIKSVASERIAVDLGDIPVEMVFRGIVHILELHDGWIDTLLKFGNDLIADSTLDCIAEIRLCCIRFHPLAGVHPEETLSICRCWSWIRRWTIASDVCTRDRVGTKVGKLYSGSRRDSRESNSEQKYKS